MSIWSWVAFKTSILAYHGRNHWCPSQSEYCQVDVVISARPSSGVEDHSPIEADDNNWHAMIESLIFTMVLSYEGSFQIACEDEYQVTMWSYYKGLLIESCNIISYRNTLISLNLTIKSLNFYRLQWVNARIWQRLCTYWWSFDTITPVQHPKKALGSAHLLSDVNDLPSVSTEEWRKCSSSIMWYDSTAKPGRSRLCCRHEWQIML